MKKIITVFAVFCAVFLISCNSSERKNLSYKIKTVTADENYLSADIRYPKFKNLPELNRIIEKDILDPYTEYKNTAGSDWDSINQIRKDTGSTTETPPFEYKVYCDPIIDSENYESLLINTYAYSGGAHGDITLDSITYDKKQKKVVSITDLNKFTVEEISQKCRETLAKNLNYTDGSAEAESDKIKWIAQGTEPLNESFQVFTYNGKTLTVYFAPYIVAPHSCGVQKVEISE